MQTVTNPTPIQHMHMHISSCCSICMLISEDFGLVVSDELVGFCAIFIASPDAPEECKLLMRLDDDFRSSSCLD